MTLLALASLAFVGSHFALSHPLRASSVGRFGERGFQLIYSVIALILFAAMIWAYASVPGQATLWTAGDAVWATASALMWLGSILFVGSFIGNPALPGAPRVAVPSGVLAITRHPMMWGFAAWAVVHLIVLATPEALLFDGAILLLALGGSLGQDRKKRKLMGERWHEWSAQTAFWPFARGLQSPGTFALVGGTLLFLIATGLHGWLGGMPAGIWRWLA